MRRIFKKGERVRLADTGNIMEVLKYIDAEFVETKGFSIESKEVYFITVKERKLSKI